MHPFLRRFLSLFVRWWLLTSIPSIAYYAFVMSVVRSVFVAELSIGLDDILTVGLVCIVGTLAALIPATLFATIHTLLTYLPLNMSDEK